MGKDCQDLTNQSDSLIKQCKIVWKSCPPIVYEGGTFAFKIFIDTFVRYNPEDQPRDKSNDPNHVNELANGFEVDGYLIKNCPPFASLETESVDPNHLRGQSGFNRSSRLNFRAKFGQEIAIYDVYEWSSRYWELLQEMLLIITGILNLVKTKKIISKKKLLMLSMLKLFLTLDTKISTILLIQ